MKSMTISKLNLTQHRKIKELVNLCCDLEPIRLSLPLPNAGEKLCGERFFVLYDQGVLISVLHLFYPDRTVGELIGFTHPDHRKKGYFRRLLDAAADYAEEIGLEQLYVITDGNSPDGIQALIRLGLEREYTEFMLQKSLSDKPSSSSDAYDVAEPSSLSVSMFSEIFGAVPEECDAYVADIADDDRIHTFVFTQNEIPVGQVQITLMDDAAYLSGFGILPAYRRQGYATLFLQKLEQLLHARGITMLTLQVSDKNKPALSLYRKDGFQTLEALSYYPLFSED